jgi:hypothetical protein
MNVLPCKLPAMVQKEFAAHLLAYNLVRSAMAKGAYLAGVLPCQLSLKGTLQLLTAFAQHLRHSPALGSPWHSAGVPARGHGAAETALLSLACGASRG